MSLETPFLSIVRKNVQEEFYKFCQLNRTDYSDTSIFKILNRKVESRAMRANFIFTMYKFLKSEGGEEGCIPTMFFERQLPFILEAIICIQYYHNQVLDGKGGVTNAAAVNRNLVLGNLFKDQFYRYLNTVALDSVTKLKLIDCVRSIFEYTDIGQYIEKHCNTYEAYCNQTFEHPFQDRVDELIESALFEEVEQIALSVIPIEEKYLPFLRIYLRRIYLTNTALFKLSTQLVAKLLTVNKAVEQKVVRFATFFGLMQQIMNDNCDFVPSICGETTVAKECEDALSDLRNRSVTLPLIIHLQRVPNGKTAKHFKENRKILMEEVFFEELTESWSIYFSMSIAKRINVLAQKRLDINSEEMKLTIKDMCEVINNNKYYKHFYNYDNRKCYRSYKRKKDKLYHNDKQKSWHYEQ